MIFFSSNFGLELLVEHLLEQLHEAAVIVLQDGVLGREIDRIAARQAVVERGAREVADRLVEIVHRHRDAGAGRLEHFALDHLAVVADELDRQRARGRELEIGGAVLVAIGVAADDDRLGPARHQPRHVLADDRLAEDHAAEDVADGAVRRPPHLLEAEFLHAALVGRDGGAFDRDADLLGLVGGVDGDLVVGLVALLDAEVVIEQIDVEIGMDQLVLDELPDDAGHLVAVHFDDRICHLDLRHSEMRPDSEVPGNGKEKGPRIARGRYSIHHERAEAGRGRRLGRRARPLDLSADGGL